MAVRNALDRHLALIGFMGAGKTTLGVEVAQRLRRPFVDLDQEIELRAKRSIAEIFAQEGEAEFRAWEEKTVAETLGRADLSVIALGGGAADEGAVRELLAARAFSVSLPVDVETAWARVRETERPLAQDEASFRELFVRRQPLYAAAADAEAADVESIVLAAGGVYLASIAAFEDGDWFLGAAELVSEARVLELHGSRGDLPTHVLPQGEDAKALSQVELLWRELRLDRDGTLVAFGGGSVTDAAGFAAATYLRGIDWIAIPTTLVGQVDAAIGGKTAVNLPEGKNLVGAFHWPARTLIDPTLLETLPAERRREGMAEVVKTGLLAGEPLWELTDAELVRRCAAYKTAVCLGDPHEQGERAILNLGHTFAHALEAAADFALSHGDAVALGLLGALRLSGQPVDAVREVLRPEPARVDRDRAWTALQRDKKRRDGRIRLVLLDAPGQPRYDAELPDADLRAALDELIAD